MQPVIPDTASRESLLPASAVPERRSVVLRGVSAGNELISRLAAMGLHIGMRIEVCRNRHHGPMVLGCNGSRIMLGRGMADKLMVEVCRA